MKTWPKTVRREKIYEYSVALGMDEIKAVADRMPPKAGKHPLEWLKGFIAAAQLYQAAQFMEKNYRAVTRIGADYRRNRRAARK